MLAAWPGISNVAMIVGTYLARKLEPKELARIRPDYFFDPVGVLTRAIQTSRVLVARKGRSIVGTLRLATKKPWAIDASMFVPVRRPLYLLDMAVAPEAQGQGFGQHLVEEAKVTARSSLAGAIWLDAYDAPAGAGPFYVKCGFREVGRAVYRGVPLIYYEWIA